MEIAQVLLNAQSPDGSVRKLAEDNLKQFQQQNYPSFLLSLTHELSNNGKPPDSRKLAGLILKNSLDAKQATRKSELVQAWIALDGTVKAQIKAALLNALLSPVLDACHTAAQVIAKIAAIELPLGQWPELIATLLSNISSSQAEHTSHIKQATLETLGYVCEEVPADSLAQDQVNAILTAVVQGMNATDGSNDVMLSATHALYDALDFAHSNFENDVERDYIMRVVFEATQSLDDRVRQAAFECLVSISSTYYEKLAPYMQDAFVITSKAVREDKEPVALQALEFWSSICDEEIELQELQEGDLSGDTDLVDFKFIKQAIPALVPLLLETLTKQDEDDEQEGAWNLAMAGGTCLGLVARTVGDEVIPLIMPYVQENISKHDWHCREAATYAFGSILEGPHLENLIVLVDRSLDFVLSALKDENSHVKETTAWTLGRIFEFLHGPSVDAPVVTKTNLPHILGALFNSIKDVSKVAEKACGAIYFLARGYEEVGSATSPLSPFFESIIQALLFTAEREDAGDTRLRASAYETLNEVVRCAAEDTSPIIVQLIPVILQKLNQILVKDAVSTDERENQNELQALLCGVLQVIMQKLGSSESTKQRVLEHSDHMMEAFLQVFACRNATVHEEAMLSVGALAYLTGADFIKYMPQFYKYLEMGLQNFVEYQVCTVTVGVVGDICRALDDKVLPFCDGIMTQLLENLSSSHLHRSVKPPILSSFGDIALSIGENFEKYLPYAMPMLQGAAELFIQATNDDDLIEYCNQLRVGILEAYSGIFQGFKHNKADLMIPYALHILQFIENVYADSQRDDAVTKASVAALGDLADAMGSSVAALFRDANFHWNLIQECRQAHDQQLNDTAEWTSGAICRIMGSSQT